MHHDTLQGARAVLVGCVLGLAAGSLAGEEVRFAVEPGGGAIVPVQPPGVPRLAAPRGAAPEYASLRDPAPRPSKKPDDDLASRFGTARHEGANHLARMRGCLQAYTHAHARARV